MAITRVTFERLISTGDYSNVSVGAEALVEEGQTPDQALSELKGWVDLQLSGFRENEQLTQQVYDKRAELQSLERRIAEARDRWSAITAWLERHGIALPTRWRDDEEMPF